jgi:hypothetical protein
MNRIIGLLFMGIGLISCRNAKPTVYFIPKNYEGVFAVVYNQILGTDIPDDPLGRRVFIIPENGILITKAAFSDGLRDDSFLQNTDSGYKTLKIYLPNKDTSGKKFGKTYYEEFSNDPNIPLINFRQVAEQTFNSYDKSGKKTGSCTFEYELITVGRASILRDSLGNIFKAKLENYLKTEFCK